jgi:plastocyanin
VTHQVNREEKAMKKILLSAILSAIPFASVTADDWGTVTGQVIVTGNVPAAELLHKQGADIKDKEVCAAADTYKDDIVINASNKGLANVFVYLSKAPKTIHPDLKTADPATVVFDQKNCVFIPHTLIARTGQTVEVISGDAVAHNTHTYPLKNAGTNVLIAPATAKGSGQKIAIKAAEILPFKVACDFHPWMTAYWLAVDHPYAAITDADGKFTVPNLPAGDHEFRIWHEKVGYINRKYTVKVKAGDNPQKPVEVSGDALKKGSLK